MRLAEKETLDATLRFFEERFDRIGQLEFYQVPPKPAGKPVGKVTTLVYAAL